MQAIVNDVLAGRITTATVLILALVALVFSLAGGSLAGLKLAGKDLGAELAALTGAMFGPTAAVPGILIGLAVLAFT